MKNETQSLDAVLLMTANRLGLSRRETAALPGIQEQATRLLTLARADIRDESTAIRTAAEALSRQLGQYRPQPLRIFRRPRALHAVQ